MSHKHCDDYIDDATAPEALRTYLTRARAPAHGMLGDGPYPTLFAEHEGKTVRIVMASRFGDVGITEHLDRTRGYDKRVYVDQLTGFRATAERTTA